MLALAFLPSCLITVWTKNSSDNIKRKTCWNSGNYMLY